MKSALTATTAGETNSRTRLAAGGFVLGIDVGGTKLALATADLHGNRLLTDGRPTLAEQGAPAASPAFSRPPEVWSRRRAGRARGELVAVGAVSPGIVLADRVLLAPNNPGWGTLALAAELPSRARHRPGGRRHRREGRCPRGSPLGHAGRCGQWGLPQPGDRCLACRDRPRPRAAGCARCSWRDRLSPDRRTQRGCLRGRPRAPGGARGRRTAR